MVGDPYEGLPPLERGVRRRLFEFGYGRQFESGFRKALKSLSWIAFSFLLVWQNPALRGRRLSGMGRFFLAQYLRKSGRTYEVDLGESGVLICPPWSSIGTILASAGSHEPGEQLFVEAFIRRGDVVIDAGANIGAYTIPVAKRGARVIAFEPSPNALEILGRAVDRNRIGSNALVLPLALSDFNGEAEVTTDLDLQNYLRVKGDESYHLESAALHPVQVRTLDTVLEERMGWLGDGKITLIKVDVEGQDEKVLLGAQETISRHRPVIMVETQYGGKSIRSLLESWDYGVNWFDPERRRLVPLPAGWGGNYQFHTNFIAVPKGKEDFVRERLANVSNMKFPRPRIRAITSSP